MKNLSDSKILCIGGANVDYKFSLEQELVLGTSNPISSKHTYGGVARNVAENLGRLGLEVSLLTLIGDDFLGKEIKSYCQKHIDMSLTSSITTKKTGSYYAVVEKTGEMSVAYSDMDICLMMDDKWIKQNEAQLSEFKILMTDLNVQVSGVKALINYCKEHKKELIIIGVSGPKMRNLPNDLKGVKLLICNLDEAQKYFSTEENNMFTLARNFLDLGLENIVITSGSQTVVYGNTELNSVFPKKHKEDEIIDVTGAGDSFSAGVIYGLLKEKDLTEAVKLGLINASLTIRSEDSVRKDLNIDLLLKQPVMMSRDKNNKKD